MFLLDDNNFSHKLSNVDLDNFLVTLSNKEYFVFNVNE